LGSRIAMKSNRSPPDTIAAGAQRLTLGRFAPLAFIVLLAGLIFAMGWHRELTLENLVKHRVALSAFVDSHFVPAIAGFVALYIAVVALSLPGATFLTIAGGVLFGVLVGGLATLVGATIGAAIIFLIAKSAIGEYLVRRAGPRLAKLAEGFRKDAFHYLLFLRLVPLFPFFLVNLAPAIVSVPLVTFLAATALGIVPATFAFAFVGAGLDSALGAQQAAYTQCLASGRSDCRLGFDLGMLATPKLIAAFVALGVIALIPVAVKKWRGRQRRV
jgi:uncharacterized membrane protein YdjX (TVP38/TMEM64 family)